MYLETLRDKNSGLEIIPSMKHSGGELGVLGLLLLHCFCLRFPFRDWVSISASGHQDEG